MAVRFFRHHQPFGTALADDGQCHLLCSQVRLRNDVARAFDPHLMRMAVALGEQGACFPRRAHGDPKHAVRGWAAIGCHARSSPTRPLASAARQRTGTIAFTRFAADAARTRI